MKVQTKILVLLLAVGAIFVAGLIFIKWREHAQFHRIATERADERKRSFDEALERFSEPLDMLAKDYTYWDGMVHAITAANPKEGLAWLQQNITTRPGKVPTLTSSGSTGSIMSCSSRPTGPMRSLD